ncbi:MAG: DNA methylase [Oscillospiraceae bacterium]|nr:DNA methylase [Oscillospiraceae bacterium]
MPIYAAIDLKSFYASVECMEHGLDPLNTNLVVADRSRTEKTICLAVSPSLKAIGVPGRPRLFEVIQKVAQENERRRRRAPNRTFTGKSCYADELAKNPALEIDYVTAPPQMRRYMEVSANIYKIYLKYIAPEDIHVYSIDEVFIDVTNYLKTYHCTAHELVMRMVRDVLDNTGITATAGIGTNLFLAKVAMDIVAKKMPPDKDGVRIAELNEQSFREQLWGHTPITDFWMIGSGTARRLESVYIHNLGELARYSETDEDRLYKLFGVKAELLIDHAWGWEPCTIAAIKAYRPENHSLSQGQVLSKPYSAEKARLIVREMTDQLVLDMVRKHVAADQIVLNIGYDHTGIPEDYAGRLVLDHYGKKTPKPAHGSVNLGRHTSSTKQILAAVMQLFDTIIDREVQVRRLNVTANHVICERDLKEDTAPVQYGLFDDVASLERKREQEKIDRAKERRLQEALLSIKGKYGKNAVLKGMNFQEGATARERNGQVGGHRA